MPAILYYNLILPLHTFPEKSTPQQIVQSCVETDPNDEINLKTREDIPTKPVKVNIESTGNAQAEAVSFGTNNQQETTEKELWKRKEETRNGITNDPPIITVSCFHADDLNKQTTIVNITQLTKPSRILK